LEATERTTGEVAVPSCSVCGEELNGGGWTDIPKFGDVCDPCHRGLVDVDGALQFDTLLTYRRWIDGLCEHGDGVRIGVAVRCRQCGLWRE